MRSLVVATLLCSAPALAETVLGAQLPDQARKVAELRYRTTQDWDDTLKYFRSVYPKEKYPRKAIVNQPGVKALHIQNPTGKGWEGLNLYLANDEVRIYVVPAEGAKAKKPAAKKGAGKK